MARAVPRHTRVAAEAAAERADEVEVKPLPLGLGVRAGLHDWHTWLVQPVHASSLGVFRVVFSICMYVQATHFNYIFEDFMTSKGVYPYPGLGWIRPPPPAVGEMLLRLNKVAALLTGLGLLTRMATVTLFVTFTWIFLVCESNHNNHYILICHVTFVFSAIDWGRWGSLDSLLAAWRRRRSGGGGADVTVPYWHLLLAQLLFSIPYAFGAVAKLNEDWMLRAQPLKMWLAPHSHHTAWVPFGFGDSPLFPWAIAWGGFAFDLCIVPLLHLHVTRYTLAFPSAIAFNISNKMMFNIGVFPYAMLASLVLFLPPCFIARVVARFVPSEGLARYTPPHWHRWVMLPVMPPRDALPEGGRGGRGGRALGWAQCGVLLFVGGFCTFHLLYPLRHFALYPAGVSWHEEGHLGAWHMKLRSKHGWVALVAVEQDGKRTVYLPQMDPMANGKQKKKIVSRPHALLLYATELAKLHIVANRSLTSLHAHSCFALNARAPLPLFTPEADLLDHLGSYELLPPFSSSAVGVWLTGQPPVANAAGASDACTLHDPTYNMRADPNAFRRLHQQAGLRYVEPSPEARRRGEPAQLHWFDRSGASQGPSYQQEWHRVDAELRAHLEARHVRPPPGSDPDDPDADVAPPLGI